MRRGKPTRENVLESARIARRRLPSVPTAFCRQRWAEEHARRGKDWARRSGMARRRRLRLPCGWCGAPVERPSSALQHGGFCCSLSHSALLGNHLRLRGDEPRPLIVCLLVDKHINLSSLEREVGLPKAVIAVGASQAEEEEARWRLLQEPWKP